MAVESTQTEQTRRVVTQFLEAINRGDFGALQDAIADDATWTMWGDLPTSGTWRGKRAIFEDFLGPAAGNYEPGSMTLAVHRVIADGPIAAAEWTNRGRLARGGDYENFYGVFFEVAEGRIVAVREYVDTQRVATIYVDR